MYFLLKIGKISSHCCVSLWEGSWFHFHHLILPSVRDFFERRSDDVFWDLILCAAHCFDWLTVSRRPTTWLCQGPGFGESEANNGREGVVFFSAWFWRFVFILMTFSFFPSLQTPSWSERSCVWVGLWWSEFKANMLWSLGALLTFHSLKKRDCRDFKKGQRVCDRDVKGICGQLFSLILSFRSLF